MQKKKVTARLQTKERTNAKSKCLFLSFPKGIKQSEILTGKKKADRHFFGFAVEKLLVRSRPLFCRVNAKRKYSEMRKIEFWPFCSENNNVDEGLSYESLQELITSLTSSRY